MWKLLTLLDLFKKNFIVLLFDITEAVRLVCLVKKKERKKKHVGLQFDATTFILHNFNSAHAFLKFLFYSYVDSK